VTVGAAVIALVDVSFFSLFFPMLDVLDSPLLKLSKRPRRAATDALPLATNAVDVCVC